MKPKRPQLQDAFALALAVVLIPAAMLIFHDCWQDVLQGQHTAHQRLVVLETERDRQLATLEETYKDDLKALQIKRQAFEESLQDLNQTIKEDERTLREAERKAHDKERQLEALRQQAAQEGLTVDADGQIIVPDQRDAGLIDQLVETFTKTTAKARQLAAQAWKLQRDLEATNARIESIDAALGKARLRVYDLNRDIGQALGTEERRTETFRRASQSLNGRLEVSIKKAREIEARWGGVLFNDSWGIGWFVVHLSGGLSSLLMGLSCFVRFLHLRGVWGPVKLGKTRSRPKGQTS